MNNCATSVDDAITGCECLRLLTPTRQKQANLFHPASNISKQLPNLHPLHCVVQCVCVLFSLWPASWRCDKKNPCLWGEPTSQWLCTVAHITRRAFTHWSIETIQMGSIFVIYREYEEQKQNQSLCFWHLLLTFIDLVWIWTHQNLSIDIVAIQNWTDERTFNSPNTQ